MMQPIYLLAIVRKRRDKTSKRKRRNNTSKMTRIAKCSFAHDSFAEDGYKIGEWWRLEIYDSPLPAMMDLVFIGLSSDPGIRCSEALAERLVSGLSLASGVKWEREAYGPIDSDYAVSKRIELEVV